MRVKKVSLGESERRKSVDSSSPIESRAINVAAAKGVSSRESDCVVGGEVISQMI